MKSSFILKLIGGILVLIAAYQLKSFYSLANSEDLSWIIGPTAWLVELFTNLSFSPEPGYGWVDVSHNVVIAPVCAGMNFLIIAFCMSAFQILWKKHALRELTIGIIIVGAASCLLTILANAVRIVLAVALFEMDIYSQWLTPDMVHRVAGIVVYYLLLCFYSQALNWWIRGKNNPGPVEEHPVRTQALLFIPLFWYLLFSVGVPFANHALQTDPELFIRHAATVGAVTLLLTLIVYKIQRCYIRVRKNRYSSHQQTVSSRN